MHITCPYIAWWLLQPPKSPACCLRMFLFQIQFLIKLEERSLRHVIGSVPCILTALTTWHFTSEKELAGVPNTECPRSDTKHAAFGMLEVDMDLVRHKPIISSSFTTLPSTFSSPNASHPVLSSWYHLTLQNLSIHNTMRSYFMIAQSLLFLSFASACHRKSVNVQPVPVSALSPLLPPAEEQMTPPYLSSCLFTVKETA
jgi:hypothetical protein